MNESRIEEVMREWLAGPDPAKRAHAARRLALGFGRQAKKLPPGPDPAIFPPLSVLFPPAPPAAADPGPEAAGEPRPDDHDRARQKVRGSPARAGRRAALLRKGHPVTTLYLNDGSGTITLTPHPGGGWSGTATRPVDPSPDEKGPGR